MTDLSQYLERRSHEPLTIDEPAEEQLRKAIASAGLEPPKTIVLDGKLHRFADGTGGKKRGDDGGWYVAFGDEFPAGAFGSWRTGETHNWRAHSSRPLSDAEEQHRLRRYEEARAAREAERKEAAEQTASASLAEWESAQEASEEHPYLSRKQIDAHGAKITEDGRLIVPLYDENGTLSSLQYIGKDGTKRYAKGGIVGGRFWWTGNFEGATQLFLAEGFATAATISEITGQPCLVAYSASNLVAVAEVARRLLPELPLTIVADNDKGGVGLSCATQAASATGARYVMPPKDDPDSSVDANDFVNAGGDLRALLMPPKAGWFVSFSDLISKPAPVSWLVRKWIPAGGLAMLHGPSGSGKTFVCLDIACRVACAEPKIEGVIPDALWCDQIVYGGTVAYLAGEGHAGIAQRVAAWNEFNHPGVGARLFVSKTGAKLDTPEGYCFVRDAIRELPEPPSLVVVDTLHRFLAGDENSSQDAGRMVAACAQMIAEFGCTVLLVHHTGVSEEAQERARGSSAWRGDLDAEINVRPAQKGSSVYVKCLKSKDGREPDEVYGDLNLVHIPGWVDDIGEQVSSLVFREGAAPIKAKKEGKVLLDSRQLFTRAWIVSGREMRGENQYVSNSALRNWLHGEKVYNKRAIDRHLEWPGGAGMVQILYDAGELEAAPHGWQATGTLSDDLALRFSEEKS